MCVAVLGSGTLLRGQCPNGFTTIFFANGIWTTFHQSYVSTYFVLKPAVQLRLTQTQNSVPQSCLAFTQAYDSRFVEANSTVIDYSEVAGQIITAIQQRGLDFGATFWTYVNLAANLVVPDWFAEAWEAGISAAVSTNAADLPTQEAWYTTAGSGNNTAIVVAHSQGNLYVNQLYPVVSLSASLRPIAVASPASHTAVADGPWFTLSDDIILNIPGALLANTTNTPACGSSFGDQFSCHNFDWSYMLGNNGQMGINSTGNFSGPAIVDAIIARIPGSSAPYRQFVPTHNMESPRTGHTATLLPEGQVLITGGWSSRGQASTTAELYTAVSGAFSPTGNLKVPRQDHSATLLPNGKVLIAGGENQNDGILSTAELYDPSTGAFTFTSGPMMAGVYGHTATLLSTGKVLIAGGTVVGGLTTAQLYDPTADAFTFTDSMSTPRSWNTATLLQNGKVLIAGGNGTMLASAEIYDPSNGSFNPTGKMVSPRFAHTATLLSDGRVLLAGGALSSGFFDYLATSELYDPTTGNFAPGPTMATARAFHAATLLQDGTVLLASGDTFCGANGTGCTTVTPTAEVFNPVSAAFGTTGNINTARDNATATLLLNGVVLITGGDTNATNALNIFSSAELYIP